MKLVIITQFPSSYFYIISLRSTYPAPTSI